MIIGVDLDNTIISYDDLIHRLAVERGLIQENAVLGKGPIRDSIRLLPDGEMEWQKLQALVYGRMIMGAKLIDGVAEFFKACRARGITTFVVSHKTEYSKVDETKTSLRASALKWMEAQGFFSAQGLGLDASRHVFFESTRGEKIARIKALKCDAFVDDLEEVFLEEDFPKNIDRVLFAPGREPQPIPGVKCLKTWTEIQNHFFPGSARDLEGEIRACVKSNLNAELLSMDRMPAGGNNQVYKLTAADGRTFVAKVYYKNPTDTRDRLDSEFRGSQFLWDNGIRAIPQPLVADRPGYFGIYEFIEGTKIVSRDATFKQLEESAKFLLKLKDLALRPAAISLPPASEACYSFSMAVGNVEKRLSLFDNFTARDRASDQIDERMIQFLRKEFEPALRRIHGWGEQRLKQSGIDPQKEITLPQRTLSPSDFGFHNALVRPSGELAFVDLEYFGWDEPVKMISDFCLHPGMNLSEAQTLHFAKFILPVFKKEDADFSARFQAMYPVFGLKWCLILLNEFLADQMGRRRFAKDTQIDQTQAREVQLNKSRAMLNRIENEHKNFPYSFS